MKSLLRLAWFVLALTPSVPAASNLSDWLPQLGLVARVGNDFISTYDVAVEVVINRSLRGKVSGAAPDQDENGHAVARILSRQIILDAAKRSANVVPDSRRLADLERLALSPYQDSPAQFETETGIEIARFRAELVQRAVADAYVRDVLYPSLRSGDKTFAGSASAPASNQLQLLEQLKTEILRLRERFFERQTIEILDDRYSLEKLLQLEDSLASM